jgi:serine/threonine-protein kinase
MQDGRHAEACPKLEESQRLDPGGGTLLNLALCHEAIGRYATALGELTEARGIARREGRQDRVDLAQEHLDAIGPKLSFISLDVTQLGGIAGVEVFRNGRAISPNAWSTRIPVDPGLQTIEARAPGHATFKTELEVKEPGVQTVRIPPLEKLPEPPPAQPPPVAPPSVVVPPSVPNGAPATSPMVWAGIGLGTAGLVSLTAGSIAAGIAAMKRSESEDIAPECDDGCSQEAVDRNDEAIVAADVATGTLVAGSVLGATGLVLLIVGLESGDEPAVQQGAWLDVGPGGAAFRAHF